MSYQYRIKFFDIEKNETTADKAIYFQLFKNNKFLHETSKIKNAIKLIIRKEGSNHELATLLKNTHCITNPHPDFILTGLTYTERHGIKLEQKIAPKSRFLNFFFSLRQAKKT